MGYRALVYVIDRLVVVLELGKGGWECGPSLHVAWSLAKPLVLQPLKIDYRATTWEVLGLSSQWYTLGGGGVK